MIHPHLKTRDGERFAVLIEPAVNVNSDVELDAAVTWHGRAVIVPFLDWTLGEPGAGHVVAVGV